MPRFASGAQACPRTLPGRKRANPRSSPAANPAAWAPGTAVQAVVGSNGAPRPASTAILAMAASPARAMAGWRVRRHRNGEKAVQDAGQPAVNRQAGLQPPKPGVDRQRAGREQAKVATRTRPFLQLVETAQDEKRAEVPRQMRCVRVHQVAGEEAPDFTVGDGLAFEHQAGRRRPKQEICRGHHGAQAKRESGRLESAPTRTIMTNGAHPPAPALRRLQATQAKTSASASPTAPWEPAPPPAPAPAPLPPP